MTEFSSPMHTNGVKKHSDRSLLRLIVLAIVVISIGFAAIGYQQYMLRLQMQMLMEELFDTTVETSVSTKSDNTVPTPVTSPMPSPVMMATTQQYQEPMYGFNFSYPIDWSAKCKPVVVGTWTGMTVCDLRAPNTIMDHGQISQGANVVFGINKPNANYQTLAEYVAFFVKQDGYQQRPRTINNITGVQLSSPTNETFVFESNDAFVIVNWIPLPPSSPYAPVVRQIVESVMKQ